MDYKPSLAVLRPTAILIFLSLCAVRCSAEKAQALFVFGDSYADTGNHNPYNQSVNQPWRPPYGLTWPGYPAGRFSSGKIQTDFWAELLGLPSPKPFELLKSHEYCRENAKKIERGVNFALGGSGIFRAYGFTTVPEQVKQFNKLLARSRGFDSQKLSRSLALISAGGNDYGSFIYNNNGSIEGLVDMVKPVVSGTIDVVKDLYDIGLRNFVVSNVGAFGCLPMVGKKSCNSSYDYTLNLHTKLLEEKVHNLTSNLKGLSIIITDLLSATNHIVSNPTKYGFMDLFLPCCAERGGVGKCGDVDEKGRALFEVCEEAEKRLFWDSAHPTQTGWFTLMSLYNNGAEEPKLNFVKGASNIIEWVHSLGFLARNISL